MTEILIEVDGAAGDAAKLYDALTSRRLPPDVKLTPVSKSDGALGLIDTILAAIGTTAGLASLVFTIAAWKTATGASVTFLVGGKKVRIDKPDQKTVEMVWELGQRDEDDEPEARQ